MSAARQRRIVIRYDVIALILILTLTYISASGPSHDQLPPVTLLQCKTLPWHEFLPSERQGSYKRPRGIRIGIIFIDASCVDV